MNFKAAKRSKVLIVALSFLAVAATGCPSDRNRAQTGYCDDSGCYQCDGDKSCWPVPNARCSTDADCSGGTRCTSIGCALPCVTDVACADGEQCVTGFCSPEGFPKVTPYTPPTGCEADTDCESDEYCKGGTCVPRCKSDDDCGPDSVCAPCGKCQPKGVPATCGAQPMFCSDSVPCGSGKQCVNNACHLQCSDGATCPVGQICESGICTDDPNPAKPACVLDLDCAGGICINGYCHDQCKTSAECGTGALCQMSVCQPDYNPVD